MAELTIPIAESVRMHERAKSVLPGGVTGAGRDTKPHSIYFRSGRGATLTDVDGNEYLEYHGGFGSAVLGYSHPEVSEAVAKATEEWGTFVGVPHEHELALAERLTEIVPCAEMVALCGGGGSDSLYHSVRIARAATGREKVIKVESGYHGWHDDLAVSTAAPNPTSNFERLPRPQPISAGSLKSTTDAVVVVSINDLDAIAEAFDQHEGEIAALVVEPALHSAGCVILDQSYLDGARALCDRHGAVLIFDEIMCGFRHDIRGVGAMYGVKADLAAFGKAIANGYVIAAVVGRRDLVSLLAPSGPVFYSGTFNGHPLSSAAAMTTLSILERDRVTERLAKMTKRLGDGINQAIAELQLNAVCQYFGSVWTLYFHARQVRSSADLGRASGPGSEELNDAFRAWMRERGVYVHRRQTLRGFVGAAHQEADIDRTVELVRGFLEEHRDALSVA